MPPVETSTGVDEVTAEHAASGHDAAVLEAERVKAKKRAERFGQEYKEPKANVVARGLMSRKEVLAMRKEQALKKMNRRGEFVAGIDVFDPEEEASGPRAPPSSARTRPPRSPRNSRRSRTGATHRTPRGLSRTPRRSRRPTPTRWTTARARTPDPRTSRRISSSPGWTPRWIPLAPDAVHLYGVDHMTTNECMGYFHEYGPVFVEWINDSSCNVVFNDEHTAGAPYDGRAPPRAPRPTPTAVWRSRGDVRGDVVALGLEFRVTAASSNSHSGSPPRRTSSPTARRGAGCCGGGGANAGERRRQAPSLRRRGQRRRPAAGGGGGERRRRRRGARGRWRIAAAACEHTATPSVAEERARRERRQAETPRRGRRRARRRRRGAAGGVDGRPTGIGTETVAGIGRDASGRRGQRRCGERRRGGRRRGRGGGASGGAPAAGWIFRGRRGGLWRRRGGRANGGGRSAAAPRWVPRCGGENPRERRRRERRRRGDVGSSIGRAGRPPSPPSAPAARACAAAARRRITRCTCRTRAELSMRCMIPEMTSPAKQQRHGRLVEPWSRGRASGELFERCAGDVPSASRAWRGCCPRRRAARRRRWI